MRRGPFQLIHRRIADAARGNVDDPSQADDVRGILQHPQIGDDVLDLFAVVEPQAAEDPVRDAPVAERVLKGPRLGVRAVQDRDLAQAAAFVRLLLNGPADEAGLVLLVERPCSRLSYRRRASASTVPWLSCRGCAQTTAPAAPRIFLVER